MLFRSPVDRAAFPKSSVHEQSMNKKVSLFVHGIRLRRSHVPQKPCERGVISKVCVPKAILEQNRAVICSRNTVTQILYASEALWTGCHFGNWNIGTKYGHFVFYEFFNWVGKRLCGKADTYGIHGLYSASGKSRGTNVTDLRIILCSSLQSCIRKQSPERPAFRGLCISCYALGIRTGN